jgi:phenylacetate-CoA ligase
MSLLSKLKVNDIKLPISVGQCLSYIPYSCRPVIRQTYVRSKKEIATFNQYGDKQKEQFIFDRIYTIVKYAISFVDFYRDYYSACNFKLSDLQIFPDIDKIPVINKDVLLKYPIGKRTNINVPKYIVNTGGSSGHSLSFYIQPSSMGHEWAHMHTIWSKLGFHPSDIKLGIAGRGNIKNCIEYDFTRHSVDLDIYKPFSTYSDLLKKLLCKHPVKYLHGYPSALYELALYCKSDTELRDLFRESLKGAFLSSEYPYSYFRDVIEAAFNIPSVSWYGHTERCVLAYEKYEKFKYYPFQTYGYTETVKKDDGTHGLIGTSYYNQASPLIRYDTEDSVNNPIYDGHILKSFEIKDGRKGQFVIDKDGNKISLTGLIFGRHHKLFDYCSHIQISQQKKGEAIILYVLNKQLPMGESPDSLFDAINVNIHFLFKEIENPIKTPSGKVNILV